MGTSFSDLYRCAASQVSKILQGTKPADLLIEHGTPTGFYFVTIGEGRRLAQLLRVKRKEIKKTEPIIETAWRRSE